MNQFSTDFQQQVSLNTPRRLLSICIGSFLGAFFCLLNVIVAMKTGLGFGSAQIVALLGYFILKVFSNYSKVENNIVQAAASGGYLSMFAIDSAVAASVIYAQNNLSVWMVFTFGILATVIGIIVAYFLEGYYVKHDQLPFPTGTATAETINSLADVSSKQARYLGIGVLVAIVITLPIQIFHWIPSSLPGNIFGSFPSFLGLALSPLIFSLGYMINWKASLTVVAGSVISYVVWFFSEGALGTISYGQHTNNMWILTLGTSILIMSALVSLWKIKAIFAKMSGETRNLFFAKAGEKKKDIFPIILLSIAIVLMFVIFYILKPHFSTLITVLVVLIPMILVTILFSSRASGETGIAPITPMGIISFFLIALFIKDFKVIIYSGAFICAAGLAAVTMINSLKTGHILKVSRNELLKAQLVGAIFGVLVGSLTIYLIGSIYGFGTEELPTPVSIAWGTIVDTMSKGQVPANINLWVGGLGAIISVLLTQLKYSAICFGIGIIIPPAYSLTILLGGLTRLLIEKRNKHDTSTLKIKLQQGQSIMAGLMVGEGIVTLIAFFIRVFKFM